MALSNHLFVNKPGVCKRPAGGAGILGAMAVLCWATGPANALEYRNFTGMNNNLANPLWGSSDQPLIRLAPAAYADGISQPNGQGRPNPRLVTLTLCQQDEPMPSRRNTSDFLWALGVFINHDIDITEAADPRIELNIAVPQGDPYFDPGGTGVQVINFGRGKFVPGTGTSVDNPLQLDNDDTAYIDLSTVYGSNEARADWLRTRAGGRLKTTSHPLGDLLPFNDGTQPNLGNFELFDNANTELFVAGDVRVNVSAFLATMHTLWMRNHNWWADQIAAVNPGLDDETLYQLARRRNIAELQHIVFAEWLPALLGEDAVPPYSGYDPNVNATCAVEFSTVILRSVGHTLLPTEILRLDEEGQVVPQGNVRLRDGFFDNAPIVVQSAGIDPILRGLAAKHCQESDIHFVDDIHHFLFTLPGAGGADLVSLNLQRARDFGIPDYNTLREAYGLARKNSFREITSNRDRADALQSLYGSVNNIDPFIGAVSEDHFGEGSVGELVHTGMLEQFERLRTGDRFWYEAAGNFTAEELAEIRATRLADIIKRNTNVRRIQDEVLFLPQPDEGPLIFGCAPISLFGLMTIGASLLVPRNLARRSLRRAAGRSARVGR